MVEFRGAPPGVRLLQCCFRLGHYRRTVYQASVLFLTFIAYTAFHMSRRPLAVVKNALNQDCSKLIPPPNIKVNNESIANWCDWAPFDKNNANQLLGLLDSVYVFAYAACMFISGMVAERIDLRYFLSLGMLISGFFTYMFGLAFYLDIHSLGYFITVQILAGAAQSTGWPGVVSCVGNWFGKGRRGLIFGIWNSHLYIGNIIGAYVAGYFIIHNWGLSFIVPGAIVGFVGIILFLFLVPHPENVDCSPTNHHDGKNGSLIHPSSNAHNIYPEVSKSSDIFYPSPVANNSCFSNGISSPEKDRITENSSLAPKQGVVKNGKKKAITFLNAIKIPGVIEFSLCLFFSKLVSYTFLFWLPRYIASTTGMGSQASAYHSIAFDVGGILGGVAAGILSDLTGSSALTCAGFLSLAIPSLFIFEAYGGTSDVFNLVLQVVCGALVNGPYALITTAVSAELGTHESIQSESKALSTVTAIIDGFGSVGAAVGPFIAGIVSQYSWSYVFYIMMLADFLALLSLSRTAKNSLCCNIKFPFMKRKVHGTYEQIA